MVTNTAFKRICIFFCFLCHFRDANSLILQARGGFIKSRWVAACRIPHGDGVTGQQSYPNQGVFLKTPFPLLPCSRARCSPRPACSPQQPPHAMPGPADFNNPLWGQGKATSKALMWVFNAVGRCHSWSVWVLWNKGQGPHPTWAHREAELPALLLLAWCLSSPQSSVN